MAELVQTSEASAPMARTSASQRWVRIIPVALIMYTIAFIDRNQHLACSAANRTGLCIWIRSSPETVAGIFFWGYLALQIPGGHLAKHWSAKKFISILLVAWGIFAVGCGLARTYHELLLLRLLLGVAESGVHPATLILLIALVPSFWNERAPMRLVALLCRLR